VTLDGLSKNHVITFIRFGYDTPDITGSYNHVLTQARIGEAVRSVVPQQMWSEIEKLEELEQRPEALDVGTDSFDDDDPYDPTEFIDEDNEF
jgi:hypothetical protein